MATRTVVIISGSGSNLQALIDRAEEIGIEICGVISNREDAYGLQRAQRAGIATALVDHRQFDSRESFDATLAETIDGMQAELVILAGFMRILTPEFTRRYEGRMLNIHPSLLPKYRGLHTHKRALEAGEQWHGATIHFVTEELDGGANIIQAPVAINSSDSEETLAARVHGVEHRIYPLAAQWFAEGRLRLQEGRAYLDGAPLPTEGYQYHD
ncbi:phosphoribosylglycinamide formyltransferase [Aestuariirhabdus litorea]|uniref:Phosphoribosylglycinamide formyltransferase n=1 Tax=Aestuariirhabdus litorea TaxID=2528527 RepID=A0A3P3VP69_9GAMM|nr:phosphoribosylglycinamide formyltransferase [Aestuariirhabdus litorea]RRJ84147.1 phosphoribosylglycinamide formyltransferase [Aestuariirhabdus litorea]RWW97367.1 phosphoribosylglycinamide formyltransferase [Endozoicomonadaceae bacterium GTF-13]